MTRPSTPRLSSTSSSSSPIEKHHESACLAALLLATPLAAEDSASAINRLLDRIVEREHVLLETLRTHTPLVETYIQETPETAGDDAHPVKDHYFLGQIRIGSDHRVHAADRADRRRSEE